MSHRFEGSSTTICRSKKSDTVCHLMIGTITITTIFMELTSISFVVMDTMYAPTLEQQKIGWVATGL